MVGRSNKLYLQKLINQKISTHLHEVERRFCNHELYIAIVVSDIGHYHRYW